MIGDGRLPSAPIVKDVRSIAGIVKALDGCAVDIVLAGFPCVGFSKSGCAGLRIHNRRFPSSHGCHSSGIPNMVMFENSRNTVSQWQDMRLMTRLLDVIGFDMMWTMCSAASGGRHIYDVVGSDLQYVEDTSTIFSIRIVRIRHVPNMAFAARAIDNAQKQVCFDKDEAPWQCYFHGGSPNVSQDARLASGVSDLSLQQSVCVGPLSETWVVQAWNSL
jgi:hypothetical protein